MQLRPARRLTGWTQAQLAERSGVDQQTISQLETGGADPAAGIPDRDLIRLCRTLRVDPQQTAEFRVEDDQ